MFFEIQILFYLFFEIYMFSLYKFDIYRLEISRLEICVFEIYNLIVIQA